MGIITTKSKSNNDIQPSPSSLFFFGFSFLEFVNAVFERSLR